MVRRGLGSFLFGLAAAVLALTLPARLPWSWPVPWGTLLLLAGLAVGACLPGDRLRVPALLAGAGAPFLLEVLPPRVLTPVCFLTGFLWALPARSLRPGPALFGAGVALLLAPAGLGPGVGLLLAAHLLLPPLHPEEPGRLRTGPLAALLGGGALGILGYLAWWLFAPPPQAFAGLLAPLGLGLLCAAWSGRTGPSQAALLLAGAALAMGIRALAAPSPETPPALLRLLAIFAPGAFALGVGLAAAGGTLLAPLLAGGAGGAFLVATFVAAAPSALAAMTPLAAFLAACLLPGPLRLRLPVLGAGALLFFLLSPRPQALAPAFHQGQRTEAGWFRRERLSGAVGGEVLRIRPNRTFGPRTRRERAEGERAVRLSLTLARERAVVGLFNPPHPDWVRPVLAHPDLEEAVVNFTSPLLRAAWGPACAARARVRGRPLTLGLPDRPLDLLLLWVQPEAALPVRPRTWVRAARWLRPHGFLCLWAPTRAPVSFWRQLLATWRDAFPRSSFLLTPEVDGVHLLGLGAHPQDRPYSPPLPRTPAEAAHLLTLPGKLAAALTELARGTVPAAVARKLPPLALSSPPLKAAASLARRLREPLPQDPAAALACGLDALAAGGEWAFVRRWLRRLGWNLLAQGHRTHARTLFAAVRKRLPDWGPAEIGLLAASLATWPPRDLEEGQWQELRARLEAALAREPRDARGWLLLGIAYYEGFQDAAAARQAFERAAALDPYDPEVKAWLWRFLDQDGRVAAAARLLLDAVSAFPERKGLAQALLGLVTPLRLAGRLRLALEALEHLRARYGREAGYHLRRSEVLWALGRREEALAAAREACRLQTPPTEGYCLHLYRLLRQTGRTREAAELRQFMQRLFGRDPDQVLSQG